MQADPSRLLSERVEAFARGDFSAIWESYHRDSPFRAQFPDRQEYLAFAAENLAGRIEIEECRVLAEEPGEERSRLIFLQRLVAGGQSQTTLELASFVREGGAWRYYASQRIDRDDFPGDPAEISFAFFDEQTDKIIF